MTKQQRPKPIVLVIMDGWGMRKETKGNAIAAANPRNFNLLWNEYPHTTLKAHGYTQTELLK